MKINLSGHHVEVSDSIREHIEEKFSKIANHFPTIIALEVIISLKHGEHHVEVSAQYEGASVSVSSKDDIMYPAIASAAKKMDAALKHRKGQLKANLHSKPLTNSPDIAHEKVQGLNLG